MDDFPVIMRLPWPANPMDWLNKLALLPNPLFLDSAMTHPSLGRYSYLAADPFLTMEYRDDSLWENGVPIEEKIFDALAARLNRFQQQSRKGLPPFQGGAAGFLGYGLGREIEALPAPGEPSSYPEASLGFYDVVIALDHGTQSAWLFSSGFPEQERSLRLARAKDRAQAINALLLHDNKKEALSSLPPLLLRPASSPAAYQEKVGRVIDYIRAGDIYQANISQQFRAALPEGYSLVSLYSQLRRHNPAPFAAYLNTGAITLLSCSPERFVKVDRGLIETRPIKGTRPRHADPDFDAKEAKALCASVKDRAENLMIVDLLRNDLSKVAALGSVKVPVLYGLESYASVHHLVSVVEARLMDGKNAVDLLRATFPGGSITGAPKIRAMEIIHELEEAERGPYCGSIFWIGFDGAMDSNIVIRTLISDGKEITLRTGCGIVADSDPQAEYQESLDKARSFLTLLEKGQ